MLRLINSPAYANLSIDQIWARELDEGRYLCQRLNQQIQSATRPRTPWGVMTGPAR